MSIKAMIKKVSTNDIKATAKSVRNFEAGSTSGAMIMIAFD